MRLAFIGFRHAHIMGFYHAAVAHERVEVVAYLRDGTSPAQLEIARSELLALPEVLEVRQVDME